MLFSAERERENRLMLQNSELLLSAKEGKIVWCGLLKAMRSSGTKLHHIGCRSLYL